MDSQLDALIRLHLARDRAELAEIAIADATAERMAAIAWGSDAGLSNARMGRALGLSRERIRQLHAQHKRLNQP